MSEKEILDHHLREIDESSKKNDIVGLYKSIQQFPKILQYIDEFQFYNTPLHEAAKMGHRKFCAEMMNLMPSFGKKLNPEGLSPLHLALQNGHRETVLALVDIDIELVRVKGIDGMTPLMYCAKSTDDDIYLKILTKFIWDCPQSIYDKNTRSQTALHVALESNNCKGAVILLHWIERSSNEKVLRIKDDQGNTPLHVAALHNCVPGVEIMVDIISLRNKRNNEDKTPLDIATNSGHEEIKTILEKREALSSKNMVQRYSTYVEFLEGPLSWSEKTLKNFYIVTKDLNNDMRNIVLVVAVLIATTTYTAILQPPGGVIDHQADATTTTTSIIGSGDPQIAASSSVPPHSKLKYYRFYIKNFVMPSNTFAFTLSIMVIIFILPVRTYTYILHICLYFLSFSCLIGKLFVSNDTGFPAAIEVLCFYLIAFTMILKVTAGTLRTLITPGLFIKEVYWISKLTSYVKAVFVSNAGDRNERNIVSNMTDVSRQRKRVNQVLSLSKLRMQYELNQQSLQLDKP